MIPGIVAGGAASGVTPPAGMDDDFSGATLDPKWTRRNNGTSTIVLSGGIATFTAQGGSLTVHQFYQPLPGPVGIWRARLAGHAVDNFSVMGIHLRDSVNSRILTIGFHHNGGGRRLIVLIYNDDTTFGGTVSEEADADPDNFQYLEIELTTTHVILRHSLDAVTWTDKFNNTKASIGGSPTFTPDQIGFSNAAFGAATGPALEVDDFTQEA